MKATARAHPNIALVKYWGKRDRVLNLPAVSSLSLTLDRYHTTTTVRWGVNQDRVRLNHEPVSGRPLERVLAFMDLVWGPDRPHVDVESENNFPTAAGLASSSSGFAALALAGSQAARQDLSKTELSLLARRGSGSACRSLWGGWVCWDRGEEPDGSDSHGTPLAPPEHWDLRMLVARIATGPKGIGSTEAMIRTEQSSPLYSDWVASSDQDFRRAIQAVHDRDLPTLGTVMEASTLRMHATMQSAVPPIQYWTSTTREAMKIVEQLRSEGLCCWFTMDAGPNVKVLCTADEAERLAAALQDCCAGVDILGAGPDAHLI